MKKILSPNPIRKAYTLKTIGISAFALFTFFAHASIAQCCAKFSSTKTCRDKSTGSATVLPCKYDNYTYKWDDAAAQTGAVATGLPAGVYHVVMSTPTFTCPAIEVIIADSACTPFSVPNIMTPNGDGINDYFAITGLEKGTKLLVFNRWGQVVYSNNNYDNEWSPNDLMDGVYFYSLTLPSGEVSNSKNDPSRGFVQIITGK